MKPEAEWSWKAQSSRSGEGETDSRLFKGRRVGCEGRFSGTREWLKNRKEEIAGKHGKGRASPELREEVDEVAKETSRKTGKLTKKEEKN